MNTIDRHLKHELFCVTPRPRKLKGHADSLSRVQTLIDGQQTRNLKCLSDTSSLLPNSVKIFIQIRVGNTTASDKLAKKYPNTCYPGKPLRLNYILIRCE